VPVLGKAGAIDADLPGHTHEGAESSAKKWWFKMAAEYAAARMRAGIFISFSIELLQTTQTNPPVCVWTLDHARIPLDFPICFPRKRVDYLKEQPDGSLRKGGAPPHASAIVCVSDDPIVRARFRESFSALGRCTGRVPT
jgi:hypothetical protein